MRKLLRAKLHGLTVTHKNLHYTGSLGVDARLLERAGISPYEWVLVVNLNNGVRFETYVIPEEPGSGRVVLNGGAARLGEVGDTLLVMAFYWGEEPPEPKIVVLG